MLAFAFPIRDWQFWLVSGIALIALWLVLRNVLPSTLGGQRGKGQSKKATLTIGGKAPETPKDR